MYSNAVQVRFALSSEDAFNQDSFGFNYVEFFESFIRFLKDQLEGVWEEEMHNILSWWNR